MTRAAEKENDILFVGDEDEALFVFFLSLFLTLKAPAAVPSYLQEDLREILVAVGWKSPKPILVSNGKLKEGEYEILCGPNKIQLQASSSLGWTSAAQDLGLLLPHPNGAALSPKSWKDSCGKKGRYEPKTKYRGFHLHLQHPSEWVTHFFEGDKKGARIFLRWLQWNQQNLLQLQLLRSPIDMDSLKMILQEAKARGIFVSLSVSFVLVQQKSFYLIPPWAQFFPGLSKSYLLQSLEELKDLPFDFLVVELGTTEFTTSPYQSTLAWLETTRLWAEKNHKRIFTKVHVSTNQVSKRWGNFNFLPRFSHPGVGVLPHTVHFFGLEENRVGMYGRKNFDDMRQFLLEQASKRPVWYYPETSYYVGLDIDVPLLLTDYLLARAADWKIVEASGIEGHVTFSTGQELGYWLKDWTVALLSRKGIQDPMVGLKLLGEKEEVWEPILRFQNSFIKKKGMLALITSSNLMDEIPFFEPLLERNIFRKLKKQPDLLREEIRLLAEAAMKAPSLSGIQNNELKTMAEVTELRIHHALALRLSLQDPQKNPLEKAVKIREIAQKKLGTIKLHWPKTLAYQSRKNPTSYPEGYAHTALRLHFWKREEEIIRGKKINPFFMNLYPPLEILF